MDAGSRTRFEAVERPPKGFIVGLLLALATWGLFFCCLWPRMLFERGDGLYAGWRTVWADWAAHFAYANVFAYWPIADWFSAHPFFATRLFDYPFLAGALSGLLMRAGLDRVLAFLVPSILASLVLVSLLYVLYAYVLRSSGRALLACSLFFTHGGVGFLVFVEQFLREPSLDLMLFPPLEYTFFPESHLVWINVVSAQLVPQRGLLLGMPIALGVLVLLWRWSQRDFANVAHTSLCGLGLLSSLLLVTHVHSYAVLVLISALLCLSNLRCWRSWMLFAAAAALPSALLFWLLYFDTPVRSFVAWHPGWLANVGNDAGPSLWLFLWLNWGVFLPIAGVAVIRRRAWRDPLVLSGLILFAGCFLFRFQPNLWDNTKFLIWADLLLCIPVAGYLAELWSRRSIAPRLLVALLMVFVTASGGLDLWRITRTEQVSARMWSSEERALARSFREVSRPTQVVLASDHPHNWVPSLAGRPVVLGYRGWLWTYGIDDAGVDRDVREMLAAGPQAEALLERYNVAFVVIGPIERKAYAANERFFEEHYSLILEGAGYRVFNVRPRVGEQAP